jgi:hypothetical protein
MLQFPHQNGTVLLAGAGFKSHVDAGLVNVPAEARTRKRQGRLGGGARTLGGRLCPAADDSLATCAGSAQYWAVGCYS